MTLRSTALLLIVVMLAASGRLLACELECLNEQPASAEASCHESSPTDRGLPTVALAEVGDVMHACLPEVNEPRVTVAKPATAHVLLAASPATVPITFARPAELAGARLAFQPRLGSPHLPAPSVLRI